MESKKLFELAEIIANFGIKEVKNVIFDDSLFLRPPSASGSEPHQAGLSALSINYNCYTAFITPMQIGLPAVVKLTPGAPYNLLNRVKTTRGERNVERYAFRKCF